MPFEKKNIRQSLRKRQREKFFTSFPDKAKQRFEHVAEKMKEISSPFSVSSIPSLQKSEEKREEKKQEFKPFDFIENTFLEPVSSPENDTKESKEDEFDVSVFYTYPRHTLRSFFIAFFLLVFLFFTAGETLNAFLSTLKKTDRTTVFTQSIETVSETFGTPLKVDEKNRTNILLLGAGGSSHDGGFLTDSIIVLSINAEKKSLSMFSIPRDLYVSYKVAGNKRKGKINQLFRDGMNYWKYRETDQSQIFANSALIAQEKVEEIIGSEIHYSAFIDFKGFEKIIDELGGISLEVEKDIYDTQYPGPNYSYTTFSLEKGLQTLDGETALKYVRSRHGNAGGDFGRSHRQKKTIVAMKEKAFKEGVLTSPEKILQLFDIIENHFWTDMEIGEILSVLNVAKDISRETIVSFGITDNPEIGVGGFLYTPPRDDIENRLSVFLPFLSGEKNPYAQIEYYWDTLSLFPEITNGTKKIEVYNTTQRPALASKTRQHLLRYGIKSSLGEEETSLVETSFVGYIPTLENEKIAEFLSRKLAMEFIPLSSFEDFSKKTIAEDADSGEKTEENVSPPFNPQDEDLFRIFIGKDFKTSPYVGTLIRRPLAEETTDFL